MFFHLQMFIFDIFCQGLWKNNNCNARVTTFFIVSGHLILEGLLKIATTVKLGNKERFDKEQIGIKELFMDYQPFYTINLLLDKELLPI